MFLNLVTWFGGHFGTSGDKLVENISIPLRFDRGFAKGVFMLALWLWFVALKA